MLITSSLIATEARPQSRMDKRFVPNVNRSKGGNGDLFVAI